MAHLVPTRVFNAPRPMHLLPSPCQRLDPEIGMEFLFAKTGGLEGNQKNNVPGTPSVLFFEATLPLKPATIALKIGHLAFQVHENWSSMYFTRWWQLKDILYVHPLLLPGEMIQFDFRIFFKWVGSTTN